MHIEYSPFIIWLNDLQNNSSKQLSWQFLLSKEIPAFSSCQAFRTLRFFFSKWKLRNGFFVSKNQFQSSTKWFLFSLWALKNGQLLSGLKIWQKQRFWELFYFELSQLVFYKHKKSFSDLILLFIIRAFVVLWFFLATPRKDMNHPQNHLKYFLNIKLWKRLFFQLLHLNCLFIHAQYELHKEMEEEIVDSSSKNVHNDRKQLLVQDLVYPITTLGILILIKGFLFF